MKAIKNILKAIGYLICAVLIVVMGLLIYLSATEYRPAAQQPAELWTRDKSVENAAGPDLEDEVFTVLSWNTGYCALGKESDFFMDGGTEVRPDSEKTIQKNYAGILKTVQETAADFILLQEVDTESSRSYGFDEASQLRQDLAETDASAAYALNFSTQFVPYPWPPIGRVNSGLLTLTGCGIT